jgi:cytochrome c
MCPTFGLPGLPQPRVHRVRGVAALLILTASGFTAGSARAQAAPTQAPIANAIARVWTSPVPGDALRGAALYENNCMACHAVDSNKVGPAHRGVMGRRVGGLKGYRYSDELARSRLRWTPQTLNLWLEDPEELVAGQRMGFQVDSAQERADLIAYLATLK